MVEKYHVSWDQVDAFIEKVIDRYKDVEDLSGVYGVPRGGYFLAGLLSEKMDIAWLVAPHKNCIVIDDIADTGETLIHYDRNSSGLDGRKKYHIVTMYYNEQLSKVVPECYYDLKTDRWIVFPWEHKEKV